MDKVFGGSMVARYPKNLPRSVSIKEICRRLDLNLMTIRSWREGSERRRKLPCQIQEYKNRRYVSIFEGDLLEYLNEYRPDLAERWRETNNK